MNIEEINAVLAPLVPRSGDSPEGYISASDLQESLSILMALVERDIQRNVAAASAYGQYVRICETELQWEAVQAEADGGTLPAGSLAIVRESATPEGTGDQVLAWDGKEWIGLYGVGGGVA